MKVSRARFTPIAIGDPPLLNAGGLHAPYALRIIIELESPEGTIGLGEIPGSVVTLAVLEGWRDLIEHRQAFDLNGFERDACVRANLPEFRKKAGLPPLKTESTPSETDPGLDQPSLRLALSGIEVACYDLIGKTTGQRVCDLLGGAMREEIPFSAYLFFKYKGAGSELGFETAPHVRGWPAQRQSEALDPSSIVKQARAMVDTFGFTSIKLKAGILEPRLEVDSIHALRESFGPGVPLRFDPNAAWKMETAVKYGKEMEGVLEYYEDPVRGQESMGKLRHEVAVPLATNMCTVRLEDLPGSLRHHSEDIILADHHFWGGLRNCRHLVRFCRVFGRGLSGHSNSHTGVSLAAMAHLAATYPSIEYDLDTHYPWQEDEVIRGGRLTFRDGKLRLPDGPGLGVELDREALNRLHDQYRRSGLTRRNDEVEMRKIQPDWTFVPTRY